MSKFYTFFLGAGLPHSGKKPAALYPTLSDYKSLDWLISAYKNIDNRFFFIGGYEINQIKKFYSKLEILNNPKWAKTKSAFSFLSVIHKASNNVFVSYADILYLPKTIQDLKENKSDIVIAIDTFWEKRFSLRPAKDIDIAEKVVIKNKKIIDIGVKLPINQQTSEFVGIVKFSKNVVDFLKQNQKQLKKSFYKKSLCELINYLRNIDFQVSFEDVHGNWAEIKYSEDIAHFILGTKAQTLQRLKNVILLSRIEEQLSFSLNEWKKNKKNILFEIDTKFKKQEVAIRSSALTEDGFIESKAGTFKSFLNISNEAKELTKSIQKVFDSYESTNINNQVLIQPMLKNVKISGVIFTRMHRSGAPYYVINYDDSSGSTDSITSGSSIADKTIIVRRNINEKLTKLPNFIKKILLATRELESLLNYNSLDIEFALTSLGLHILQVRPITSIKQNDFRDEIVFKKINLAKKKFNLLQKPSKKVAKSKSIYGIMPDWNPAEIIGVNPTPLSSSLYKNLILDSIWSRQRYEYGYSDIRQNKLLINFAHHQYIDIRASFSSFVPKNISQNLKNKLVAFYVSYLESNPHLDDKIEFDVVPNSFVFDSHKWKKRLSQKAKLKDSEILSLEMGLKKITSNAFTRVNKDLKKINELSNRYNKIINSNHDDLSKIKLLLKDCRNYGTLPFAHLARSAFIAVNLLKTAVSSKIISNDAYLSFMGSIRTISHQLGEDAYLVKKGNLRLSKFIEKYSHLRPGTYDINSQSYGDNIKYYLLPLISDKKRFNSNKNLKIWHKEKEKLINSLNKNGFKINIKSFEEFLYKSIEGREYAKFIFSKNISSSLKLLQKWSKKNKLSYHQVSLLKINEVLSINKNNLNNYDIKKLKSTISKRDKEHSYSKLIELPSLICNESDFDFFSLTKNYPNFIGKKNIIAKSIEFYKNKKNINKNYLQGKIILIPQADPGYDWLFSHKIAGLITMYGGVNSHMSIRAAEFQIPAAIGIGQKFYDSLSTAEIIEINPVLKQLKKVR